MDTRYEERQTRAKEDHEAATTSLRAQERELRARIAERLTARPPEAATPPTPRPVLSSVMQTVMNTLEEMGAATAAEIAERVGKSTGQVSAILRECRQRRIAAYLADQAVYIAADDGVPIMTPQAKAKLSTTGVSQS